MELQETSNDSSHVYANAGLTSAAERPASQFPTTPEPQPVRPAIAPRVPPPIAKKPKTNSKSSADCALHCSTITTATKSAATAAAAAGCVVRIRNAKP